MSQKNGSKNPTLIRFLAAFGLTAAAAVIAGLFSMNSSMIYEALELPSFAPPAALFMPVWIILYILMAVAFFIILQKGGETAEKKNAVNYYIIQLVFNVFWSLLFFTFCLRVAALIDIFILVVYIIITTVKFYRINKAAGILMLPYLIWTVFATILNFAIVVLNG
jgi:benzodiazapine receptor